MLLSFRMFRTEDRMDPTILVNFFSSPGEREKNGLAVGKFQILRLQKCFQCTKHPT